MNKKILVLIPFLFVLIAVFSSFAYALDVSIDRVRVNGRAFAESETNFIQDTNDLDIVASLTAIKDISNIHVEAILVDQGSGRTIADSSGTFSLKANQNTLVALSHKLIDRLKRQKNFRLEIKVVDVKGNTETKSYGLRFTGAEPGVGKLDVSIDRIRVNSKVVAETKTNFIDESNSFDALVDFTALEDLENARVEAVLRDLRSGFVVSDATPNFNLKADNSASRSLRLELIDKLKQSNSFELTIRIIDVEGTSVQKTFGLRMEDGDGVSDRELDMSIDSIELEGDVLAENENNFVVIDKSEKELDLRVKLTALENVKDAHIDAILTFENGDVVADATTTFSINDGQNIVKELELPVIGKFEQNNFKLKLRVVDAEGDSEEKLYGLKLSTKKFPFIISSIALSPESNIEAGKALVARLNFKNSGVVPLEGVSAKVSIPELGIASTKFIDQIKNSKLSEVREDFVLKILDSVPTGTYTLKSEIASQFGGQAEVKEIPVFILGKNEQKAQVVNDKLVINVPIVKQDIKNDGSEVIYPLILTNAGHDANAYTILLDGANWANLRLADSNVFVIKPGEAKTVNVYASTNANVIGENIFLVSIKSKDSVLKQIALKGDVAGVAPVKGLLAAKLKNVLELLLIGLVVFLVAIGFFFGVKRYMQKEDVSEEIPDEEQGEAYY